nr:MAG TPA: LONG TAIL FIBER PROTEIN [Caudoviricetes sp.]
MPNVVITSAGLAALVNAENNGTLPVKITKFGLGTGNYTPSADQTALQNQFKEIAALSGGDVGDNTIHVTMSDPSSDAYTANEVGVYLEDGTLFAVSSQPTGAILQKASGSEGLISFDFVVSGGTSAITVEGGTNFFNPPATTETAGVVKLASLEEIKTGTNSDKAVTPSGVFNFVKTYVTEAIEALKTLLRKEIAAAALAAVPIGTVIFYLGTEIPEGYLLTNGASVAKADFKDLYSVVGNKFGNVDDDHFNLPDTHHRFLEGTTVLSEVGAYIAAGVPNILSSGRGFDDQFDISQFGFSDLTGAMFISRQGPRKYDRSMYESSSNGALAWSFDASRNSAVYGASNTNQPKSLRGQFLIRYM